MQFEGIITPVVTPHRDDHSIDNDRFAEVLEFLVGAGIHAALIAGTTGEYYAQTADERLDLMTRARDVLGTRLPLIVGTGAIRTEDSIALAEAARAVGADAILITTPPYACPTGREIAQHALAIDRAADLPVLLYNYPGRMSVNMDEETLDHLGRSPNFRAIKESSGDPNRLHMLACDYPQIALSCGMDDQALEFFAWGATSWTCAGSNFAPEAHMAMYRACAVEKDFDKGRRIMAAMLPLMRMLEQGGKFVQSVKYGMSGRGIDCGPPRRPLMGLEEGEMQAFDEVVATMNRTVEAIGRDDGMGRP